MVLWATHAYNSETRTSSENVFNLLTWNFSEVCILSHCVPTSFELSIFHPSGIPFAEPPVDDLRLSSPRPKYSLSPLRSFDARSYGYTCIQPRNLIFLPQLSFADMSEDCLTLNIFRPSGVDVESSLPVMIWIYGGGFLCAWWMSRRFSRLTPFHRWRFLRL